MKLERARELYSDYAEGILSPALRQALDQHLEASAEARADYEEFAKFYRFMDRIEVPEVQVPVGFRERVMQLAAEQQARRQPEPVRKPSFSLRGLFNMQTAIGRRQAIGVFALAMSALAVAFIVIANPIGTSAPASMIGPSAVHSAAAPRTIIQGIADQTGADGKVTRSIDCRLASGMPSETVTAYVLDSNDEIVDSALRQQKAQPALDQPAAISNDQQLQIPVNPTDAAGITTVYVAWAPNTGGGASGGAQVVFVPGAQSETTVPAPTETIPAGGFYDSLKQIAADYNITVVADAAKMPNRHIPAIQPSGNAMQDLDTVATASPHYTVRKIDNAVYEIYRN